MDRLLCGDVGYGKTEVAMRAAFKAIDSGYQVAVLVPTTVLAEQHLRTFPRGWPSFPSPSPRLAASPRGDSRSEIIERLAERLDRHRHRHAPACAGRRQVSQLGPGDHRRRAALRRRGQGETQVMRQTVDVLTMTATPIPRTLHMGLIGARDISQPGDAARGPPGGRNPSRPLR